MDGYDSRNRSYEIGHKRPSLLNGQRAELELPTVEQTEAYNRAIRSKPVIEKPMCKFKAGRLNGMVIEHYGSNVFCYGYLRPL